MDGFSSLQELYDRIKPALRSKCKDLERIGITYIKEEDVWNYLKGKVWINSSNLTLGEMVNDIMTVSNEELMNYVHTMLEKR